MTVRSYRLLSDECALIQTCEQEEELLEHVANESWRVLLVELRDAERSERRPIVNAEFLAQET